MTNLVRVTLRLGRPFDSNCLTCPRSLGKSFSIHRAPSASGHGGVPEIESPTDRRASCSTPQEVGTQSIDCPRRPRPAPLQATFGIRHTSRMPWPCQVLHALGQELFTS